MRAIHAHPIPTEAPARWRTQFRRLLALRDSLLDEATIQPGQATAPLSPHHKDPAKRASDAYDHDLSLGILVHHPHALQEIDAALGRILEGSYGICEQTGKPIPSARLALVPWTRFTREALERIERRQRGARRMPPWRRGQTPIPEESPRP